MRSKCDSERTGSMLMRLRWFSVARAGAASRRLLQLCPLLVLLLDGRPAAATETITFPFQGVTLISRTEYLPRPVTLHVALIDLTAPGVRFKLTPPGGTRDALRQTTREFLEQERAQLAINAHFFVPFPSADPNANLVGLAASEGWVYSPFESQPVARGQADQSFAIVRYAPALNLDAQNRARLVHRSWFDPRRVRERVRLWNALAGSAQIVRRGRPSLPAYGWLGRLQRGLGFSNRNSWYDLPRGRTAIGLTADRRTLVLFTVNGRDDGGGLTVREMAAWLIRDYRVYEALNLDGGGSTTMVIQDPPTGLGRILNLPGDHPRGRSVGSNLAVFALPPATERN